MLMQTKLDVATIGSPPEQMLEGHEAEVLSVRAPIREGRLGEPLHHHNSPTSAATLYRDNRSSVDVAPAEEVDPAN